MQTEKDEYHMISLICGMLVKAINEFFLKKYTKSHRCRGKKKKKKSYGYQGVRGETNLGTGIDIHTL